MSVLNVLCLSDEDFATELGKRTDDRDVESYVFKEKRGDSQDALTFLRPRKHPERLRPLLASLDIVDSAIIQVRRVDASLGEVFVAASVAGIERGVAVINAEDGGWVDPDQVEKILKQAGLTTWQIMGKLFISSNGLPFNLLADILDGIIIIVLLIYSTLISIYASNRRKSAN